MRYVKHHSLGYGETMKDETDKESMRYLIYHLKDDQNKFYYFAYIKVVHGDKSHLNHNQSPKFVNNTIEAYRQLIEVLRS